MWNRSRGWLPKFKAHTGTSEEKLGDCWASREMEDLDSYITSVMEGSMYQ